MFLRYLSDTDRNPDLQWDLRLHDNVTLTGRIVDQSFSTAGHPLMVTIVQEVLLWDGQTQEYVTGLIRKDVPWTSIIYVREFGK